MPLYKGTQFERNRDYNFPEFVCIKKIDYEVSSW